MKIKLFTNPILRQKATEVKEFDPSLKALVDTMTEVMYREEGIGLAANQIGDSRSVCVIDSSEPDANGVRNKPRVFINPKITAATSEFVKIDESCLSIPGVFAQTERHRELTVVYNTIEGHQVEEILKDLDAIAMQHEVDHLEGRLFIDMLGPMKKNLVLEKCKKFLKAKSRGMA